MIQTLSEIPQLQCTDKEVDVLGEQDSAGTSRTGGTGSTGMCVAAFVSIHHPIKVRLCGIEGFVYILPPWDPQARGRG